MLKKIDERFAENFFKNYYHDRGMLKWQGFYLSDHLNALKKAKAAQQRKLTAFKNQSDDQTNDV